MVDVSAPGKVVQRDIKSDRTDRMLFIILFLVGAGAIVTLKILFETGIGAGLLPTWRGAPQVVVTAVPCLLMAVYAIVAVRTPRFKLRADRVGDNLYYLGFLYTLVSLAYALYKFGQPGTAAEDIITNFGIAIFSTIFGLAGRVFFNQMRDDPLEFEDEAVDSLAEATRSLRARLEDITTELSLFKTRFTNMLHEGTDHALKTADRLVADSVQRFATTSQAASEQLRSTAEVVTDHSFRLTEIGNRNIGALEVLVNRIKAIQVAPEMIVSMMQPAVAKFQEAAEEATQRNKSHASDVKRLKTLVETATEAAESLHKTMAGADQGVRTELRDLAASLTTSTAAAKDFAAVIGGGVGTLADDLSAARRTVASLLEAVQAEGQAVRVGYGEMRASFGFQQKTLGVLRAGIESELKAVQEHQRGLAAAVTESRQGLEELQKALISVAKSLGEQLGGR